MKSNTCEICNSIPANIISVLSYIRVCKKHEHYHMYFQVEIIKKQLGLISEFSDAFKKCEICNVELNSIEINSLEKTDIQRTCKMHREVRKFVQKDAAIEWFEYKKTHPNINIKTINPISITAFSRWRRSIKTNP